MHSSPLMSKTNEAPASSWSSWFNLVTDSYNFGMSSLSLILPVTQFPEEMWTWNIPTVLISIRDWGSIVAPVLLPSLMKCVTIVSSPHLSFPSANGYTWTGWSLRRSVLLSLPFVLKLAVVNRGSFIFEWWDGVSVTNGVTVPSFASWNGLLKASSQQGQLDSDFWKDINLTWFGWVVWESWLWVVRCCLLGSFSKLEVGMWHGDFCFLWPVVLDSHALVLSG